MICDKCDPAGHIAGEERQFLERIRAERVKELATLHAVLSQMVEGKRPYSRFTGENIATVLRDLDAIQNLGIVVG
jgi:hypothetical protein